MSPTFLHGLIVHFFLSLNSIPLYGCTIAYPFTYQRASCLLQSFVIINKAAINIHMQVFLWHNFQVSWAKIPRSTTAMLHNKITFSFLRNWQRVFQSGCTIFAFSPAMDENFCGSISLPAVGIVRFVDFRILIGVHWYHTVKYNLW